MRWVGMMVVEGFPQEPNSLGEKRFLILWVLAPRPRYRLADGSTSKSLLLGWLGSLMILWAFLTHRALYVS